MAAESDKARIEERIEDVDVSTEMQRSYAEYAMSVIHARALPDARDGLKPVQRRILYMMRDMGLSPEKGHVKSARVVGEVMGKLHPHGDSAIYDALVRLARGFAMRVPLVDGHGNFGSLDDGPAAARYTEARLTKAAMILTDGLDEDVVDFEPNYDNQLQQPSVLPAAFPNLLVNGASGIAVGMATNMAPHNLGEAVEAAIHLLEHPGATVDELMHYLPGPDLPSGGSIVGLDGVRQAYATGRGSFTMRATASIERVSPRKMGIVITELPYMVGPEQVVAKVKDAVTAKKISGISDLHDLTDRHNDLRLVIEVKTGFDPHAVLAELYRLTPLETSFGINNVVLVNGRPETAGLRRLLQVYLDHQVAVVTRRTRFRLARAKERLHLVEGLLIAIVDIDEVIAVIRSSDDAAIAKQRLRSVFDLSEAQADYILELRLRRLTKFSQVELEAERDELHRRIATLEEILGSQEATHREVIRELRAVATEIGDARRTVLLEHAGAAPSEAAGGGATAPSAARRRRRPASLEIPDTPCTVLVGADGRVVRSAGSHRLGTGWGDTSPDDAAPATGEPVAAVVPATTRGNVVVLTDHGHAHRVPVVVLAEVSEHSISFGAGQPLDSLAQLDRDEHAVAVVPDATDDAAAPIGIITRDGVVKRTRPEWPNADDWSVIGLKGDDRVVAAASAPDAAEFVFVTSSAQLLRYSTSLVRPQGPAGGGIAGIKLSDGDQVIAGAVVPEPDAATVFTMAGEDSALPGTGTQSAKVTPLREFPAKGRATGGVRAQRLLQGETALQAAWVGPGLPVAADAEGRPVALPSEFGRRDGSGERLDATVTAVGAGLAV